MKELEIKTSDIEEGAIAHGKTKKMITSRVGARNSFRAGVKWALEKLNNPMGDIPSEAFLSDYINKK